MQRPLAAEGHFTMENLIESVPENIEDPSLNDSNENQEKDSYPEEEGNENKFNEGQLITLIRVRFPGNSKSFPFLIGKRKFEYGRKVLAMSDRGVAVGYINSFPYEVKFDKSLLPIRSILKLATDQDVEKDLQNFSREREAKDICKNLITKHNLDMELTHVEYTQFGKKAVFYFTSPARVDFRNLVKDLLGDLKMRIELRQIGWRDRTAALGGIGPCGRQLCCNSFLSKYGNVSLKMAKNQNLTLNPGRLNGVCGQLKCCIQYEDEVYQEKTARLPAIGLFLLTVNGDRGKVEKHHILVEQFEMITDEGKRKRYAINQFDPNLKLPQGWHFPTGFEHIINETDVCIGLAKKELDKTTQFLKNMVGPHGLTLEKNDEPEEEIYHEKMDDHQAELDEDDNGNEDSEEMGEEGSQNLSPHSEIASPREQIQPTRRPPENQKYPERQQGSSAKNFARGPSTQRQQRGPRENTNQQQRGPHPSARPTTSSVAGDNKSSDGQSNPRGRNSGRRNRRRRPPPS